MRYICNERHVEKLGLLVSESNGIIDELNNEFIAFLEAAVDSPDTHIMLEELYPKIEMVLATSVGDRKFKQYVGNFMDKNNEMLHKAGPVSNIIFARDDKKPYYDLFKVSEPEIVKLVKKVLETIHSNSEFKLLTGNPIFWVFYCCIRFYHLKRDQKGLNTALAIYALSVYPSVFHLFFPYGANESVMQYTMDNLTDKYIMKQQGYLFGALFISINHSYDFLKPYMKDANDKEFIRFIQRIHNDQKSMIKKICDQYMKNHAKGLRVTLTKDSQADAIRVDDEQQNKTTTVEYVSRKVCLPILTNGADLRRIDMSAKVAAVGISDTRFYINKIINDKHGEEIQNFVEAILFIFLYDDNHVSEDINSSMFLPWCADLFRKTNSNNQNIKTIKTFLDKWAEEIGIHAKFTREASRVNYKKAIFFYFVFSIQAYNK